MNESTIEYIIERIQNGTIYHRIRSVVPFIWIGEIIAETLNQKIIHILGILQNWTTNFLSRRLLTILVIINPHLSTEQQKRLLTILSRIIEKIISEKSIDPREMRGIVALACPNQNTALLFSYLLDTISGIADSIRSERELFRYQSCETEPDVEVGNVPEPSTLIPVAETNAFSDVCSCSEFQSVRFAVCYSDSLAKENQTWTGDNDSRTCSGVSSSGNNFQANKCLEDSKCAPDYLSGPGQKDSSLGQASGEKNIGQETENLQESNFGQEKKLWESNLTNETEFLVESNANCGQNSESNSKLRQEKKHNQQNICVGKHEIEKNFHSETKNFHSKNLTTPTSLQNPLFLNITSKQYLEEVIISHSLSYYCCVESVYVAAMPSMIRKTILESLWGKDVVRKHIISKGNFVSNLNYKLILKSISLPSCCISLDVLMLQDGTMSNDVVAIVQKMHGYDNKNYAHLYKGSALYDWLSSTAMPNNPKTRSQVLPTDIYRLS